MPMKPKTHLQLLREQNPPKVKHKRDRCKYYNTAQWRTGRKLYLASNPLCVMCDIPTPATVVDHITPHRGDPSVFFDSDNWQGLCKMHHDQKTGRGQ